MGIAKKTDGRYVVGLGVTDANDYKGSASYRDIYIQLTESGATAKSEEYLTFLKDYGFHANASGEPIMPPSVNVWISNNGVTTAVEADDVSIDGSNYTICGIKWDGSTWDYSNAGQGGGGSGSGLPPYSSSDIGKVLTVGEGSETVQTVIVPEQTMRITSDMPVQLSGVDISAFVVGAQAVMDVSDGDVHSEDIVTCFEDDGTLLFDNNKNCFIFVQDGVAYLSSTIRGTVTISLTSFVPSVEPKWEAAGLPDYSDAAEGAALKIVGGVPTWTTT